MSIRQRGRKKVKTVRVLTDADPRRVSLVENGANQTPWREIKTAAKAKRKVAETTKENEMAKNKTQKSGAELVRVTFSKAKFKDEAAVKAWLTEKGYDETEIKEEGENFVVTSPTFVEAKSKDLRVIEAEAGIQYFVNKEDAEKATKGGEGGDEDEVDDEPEDEGEEEAEGENDENEEGDASDAEASKAAKQAAAKEELGKIRKELTEKVNMMRVYYSDKQGMKDVLKEADDGMPIGVGDLYGLFTKALQNAAASGDTDAVKDVSAEFGDMFTSMMDVTNKFIAGAKDTKDKSDKTAEAGATAEGSDEADKAAKEAAAKAAEGDAAVSKEVTTLKEQVAKAAKDAQETNTALKAMTDLVDKLTKSVDALTKRISELETVEQSRKGADEEANTKTTKKSEALSKLEKNLWGI